MGRKKIYSPALLVSLVDGLYEQERGNTRLLNTELERYASSRGIDAKEHIFRRSKEVQARVQELRALEETGSAPALVYRPMDLDALFREVSSMEDLKGRLRALDESWKKVYEHGLALQQENRRLQERASQTGAREQELQQQVRSLEGTLSHQKEEGKKLKEQNAALVRLFYRYVYKEAAVQILKERIPYLEQADYINPEGLKDLIAPPSWDTPMDLQEAAWEDAVKRSAAAEADEYEEDGEDDEEDLLIRMFGSGENTKVDGHRKG